MALIALHARRSRTAIRAWSRSRPDAALLVALTGTDLYRDLPAGDTDAVASIAVADRLIALQDDAPTHLPPAARARTDVVYQSARTLKPWPGKRDRPAALPAGGAPARREGSAHGVRGMARAGAGRSGDAQHHRRAAGPALGDAARALAGADPRVRVLGARPHAWTRQAIKRAHLLLVPSRMEGGANVVVEAVTSGTPVLGSRMSGNVGMLAIRLPRLVRRRRRVGPRRAGAARPRRPRLPAPSWLRPARAARRASRRPPRPRPCATASSAPGPRRTCRAGRMSDLAAARTPAPSNSGTP